MATLTAVADASSVFTGWSGACTGTGVCQTTIDQAKTVTATFALKTYTVTAITDQNGSVDPGTPTPATVVHNGTTSVTFNANAGYHIASIESTCGGAGYTNFTNAVTSYTYSSPGITDDCTVFGAFAANMYGLAVTRTGTGTVTSSQGGIDCGTSCVAVFGSGTTVTLTATPGNGYTAFTGWSGSCAGTDPVCQVTMNSAKSAIASFKTTLPPATDATFTASPVSPQVQGRPAVFTAQGIGGTGSYEYMFRFKSSTTSWTNVQAFSTNNAWTWDTTGVAPGAYSVLVRVRTAGSGVLYDVYKQLNYTIIPPPVADATLTPGLASPQNQGAQIAFSGQGIGGTGSYEYQFRLKSSTSEWLDVQAMSTNNTWTWNTTGVAGGNYQIQLRVRNAGSTVAYDVLKTVDYTITLPPVTDATLTPGPASPQSQGTQIAFTGQGIGGTGSYEYLFRFKSSTSVWTEVQAYSTNAVWTWNTTGVTPGTYQVQVRVRNVGSTVAYDVLKAVSYVINP